MVPLIYAFTNDIFFLYLGNLKNNYDKFDDIGNGGHEHKSVPDILRNKINKC